MGLNTSNINRNLGRLMEWLINEKNRTFYGMKLPTGFQLIGQTTLKQYQDWLVYFDQQSRLESHYISRKTMRAYARVGVSIMSTIFKISSNVIRKKLCLMN